ncbi:MAG TPA: 3-dehydroquinate synthase [Syntrophothermus lipocalidus]|nr:3-dehydroquinate synthase [Syntrophothermus lipocalidus]
MAKVSVNLGARSYDIHIGANLLEQSGQIIKEGARSENLFLVSNPTVFSLYGAAVIKSCEDSGLKVVATLIPDGEEYKTMGQAEEVIGEAIRRGIDRESLLVALGGGVVGDLAGFVAAVYQRGIDFVQIPTTLLAQVDSSVGGKVAVNHQAGKNMIGAFHQPRTVIVDVHTLASLSEREFAAGMAEVVKYGIILDESFFVFLENRLSDIKDRDEQVMESIVKRCCELKAMVVEEDETERGLRAVLNLGHTFGHAVETLTGYSAYRHGEAVSIGMILACSLARDLGLMGAGEVERVVGILVELGLPVRLPQIDSRSVLNAMYRDKKTRGGKLRLVLPCGIGRAVVRDDIDDELILKVLCNQSQATDAH